MARVHVEIGSWLADEVGWTGDRPAVWQEDIGEGMSVGDLLASVAHRHARFARTVFDLADRHPYDHVAVILNDRVLQAQGGLDAELRDGDRLVVLPGFSGG